MARFTTLLGVLVLVVCACAGGTSTAPTAVPAIDTPPPAATAEATQATPTPEATVPAVSVAVTFDGTTCTYAGPTVVPRGTPVTFTMANTPAAVESSGGAHLAVLPVVDGTGWDRVLADTAVIPASGVPEWAVVPGAGADGLGEVRILPTDAAAAGSTLTVSMSRNAYYVGCHSLLNGNDKAFPAILLQVVDTGG